MKTEAVDTTVNELDKLCISIRELVGDGDYESCMEPICEAMEHSPDAPEPHNLLGIVLEKQGKHTAAMKHFRAACALDPTYAPALQNLDTYGTFFSCGKCAFDESDIPGVKTGGIEIVYDSKGIGHAVRKTRIEYDSNGIGHVVRM